PFLLIDFENSNAIAATIGGIKEFGRGMNCDFGSSAGARKPWREGRNVLQFLQYPGFRLIREYGNGRVEFVNNIGKAAVGSEDHVARARPGFNIGKSGLMRSQCSLFRIELVDENSVQPKIADKSKAIARV